MLALVNQLGPHAPEALGEAQVGQLQAGHDLAGIGEEQTAPQPGHFKQHILQDVVANIGHAEQLPEHQHHRKI